MKQGKKQLNVSKLLPYLGLGLTLASISCEALAAFDLDAFGKAISDPTKKFVNDYYPVGIFVVGLGGAFLQRDGDMRERFVGFGKGAALAGIVVAAAKAGFGM